MKALITGATGFTGKHLTRKVLDKGMDVRVFIRPENRSKLDFSEKDLEVSEGNLSDADSLEKATRDIDVVFHIAAMYREAGLPESSYHDVNAKGTERLLKASLENKVERFVHCSTIGVLGNIASPPANEETPHNPGDEYQRSKLAGELAALRYHKEFGLPVAVIRPAAIYGPGDLRLLKMFRMIARGRAVMVGNGETLYHMVYIDDLVKGFLLASESQKAVGEVFIIADREYTTLNDLYRMIARELDVPLKKWSLPVVPMRALATVMETVLPPIGISPPLYRRRVDFFTKNRAFDISKAIDTLGYRPDYPLVDGIRNTASWYAEKGLL